MRLYLSSFRVGDQPRRLVELAGANKRALVIANACDLFGEPQRKQRVEREFAALQSLGFHADELDLRDYFLPNPNSLGEALAECGLVWVRGGNAFVLRRAMRQSGFDNLIIDSLGRDALVYGGYSGGIAVLPPMLDGLELVNDPVAVPLGYDRAVIWTGLGIIPYALAPHYKSAHPASPGIDKVVAYFEEHNIPYKKIRDGQAWIVSGDREELA